MRLRVYKQILEKNQICLSIFHNFVFCRIHFVICMYKQELQKKKINALNLDRIFPTEP